MKGFEMSVKRWLGVLSRAGVGKLLRWMSQSCPSKFCETQGPQAGWTCASPFHLEVWRSAVSSMTVISPGCEKWLREVSKKSPLPGLGLPQPQWGMGELSAFPPARERWPGRHREEVGAFTKGAGGLQQGCSVNPK